MFDSEKNLCFWDHIEDLRTVIIRSGIVVFLGFILALCFHQQLFRVLTANWQEKTASSLEKKEIKHFRIFNSTPQSQLYEIPIQAKILHLKNSHPESTHSNFYLIESQGLLDYEVSSTPKLLFLSPLEGLLLTFKVSFWLSFALTSPLWGWIIFGFISPGMYSNEKALVFPFILGSFICMGLGIVLAYLVTIPLANQYLQAFNASLGENSWTFSNYVDYTLLIIFGHIIAFELSLLLLLMVHFRMLSAEWLISKRRYMMVAAFLLAALLTPPDVLTQFALAIPLICLYEIAILYGKWRQFPTS